MIADRFNGGELGSCHSACCRLRKLFEYSEAGRGNETCGGRA